MVVQAFKLRHDLPKGIIDEVANVELGYVQVLHCVPIVLLYIKFNITYIYLIF